MPKRPAQSGAGKHPWDHQPSETDVAFEAFLVYRNMGPSRSVRAVGKSLGKNAVGLEAYCTKHNWKDRATQWDAFVAQQRDAGILASAKQSGLDFFALRDRFIRRGVESAEKLAAQADGLVEYIELRLTAARRADAKLTADADADADGDDPDAVMHTNLRSVKAGKILGRRSNKMGGGSSGDAEDVAFADAKLARDWAAVLKDASVIHEKASALGWAAMNAGLGDAMAERDAAKGNAKDDLSTDSAAAN